MGKAKRRSIALGKHNQLDNLSREGAIELVLEKLSKKESIEDIVTLFGLKPEELLEAGVDYEIVMSLGRFF